MTCIVGYVTKKKVYIGGDSCASTGYNNYIYAKDEGKVFKKGNMIFGLTGTSRMAQIVSHNFKVPTKTKSYTDIQYLSGQLMPALLKTFQENKIFKIKDERMEEAWGALLGYNGELYRIDSAFNLMKSNKAYAAHGCGQDFALGALYEMEGRQMPAEIRIENAIKAAAEFSAHVSPPFVLVEL